MGRNRVGPLPRNRVVPFRRNQGGPIRGNPAGKAEGNLSSAVSEMFKFLASCELTQFPISEIKCSTSVSPIYRTDAVSLPENENLNPDSVGRKSRATRYSAHVLFRRSSIARRRCSAVRHCGTRPASDTMVAHSLALGFEILELSRMVENQPKDHGKGHMVLCCM
jgi:hypothetical protein